MQAALDATTGTQHASHAWEDPRHQGQALAHERHLRPLDAVHGCLDHAPVTEQVVLVLVVLLARNVRALLDELVVGKQRTGAAQEIAIHQFLSQVGSLGWVILIGHHSLVPRLAVRISQTHGHSNHRRCCCRHAQCTTLEQWLFCKPHAGVDVCVLGIVHCLQNRNLRDRLGGVQEPPDIAHPVRQDVARSHAGYLSGAAGDITFCKGFSLALHVDRRLADHDRGLRKLRVAGSHLLPFRPRLRRHAARADVFNRLPQVFRELVCDGLDEIKVASLIRQQLPDCISRNRRLSHHGQRRLFDLGLELTRLLPAEGSLIAKQSADKEIAETIFICHQLSALTPSAVSRPDCSNDWTSSCSRICCCASAAAACSAPSCS